MANFDLPRHDWDVYRKARVKGHLEKQAATNHPGTMYFSNYIETGKYLRENKALQKAMFRETQRVHRSILSAIPKKEDGASSKIADQLKIRHLKRGGKDDDRMAYHIYVNVKKRGDAASQFISAQRASQFSKEAWQKRHLIDKETGKYQNPAGEPNRMGWIDKGLNWASGGREIRGRWKDQ